MKTLNQWLSEHDFHLSDEDRDFLSAVSDDNGITAECSTADWSLFIGDGFVVENTIQGTSLNDNDSLYSLRSFPTHIEVRETTGTRKGISSECLFVAITNAAGSESRNVILVTE